MNRNAIVRVEPLYDPSKLNFNDLEVAGDYSITLRDEVTTEQIADVALDVFFSNIPVKMLDDFKFTVLFNGEEMEPNPDHESYTLQHLGDI